MQDLPLTIRQLRKEHNLTLEALGNKIGRSKQWVSELERGNIKLSFEMACKISSIYGRGPDIFLR